MIVVYKYPLNLGAETQTIAMPKYSEIIAFKFQPLQGARETLFIWALVDTNRPNEDRRFLLYGTGVSINIERYVRHVGTAMSHNGVFVVHCFEEK
jgi:hypothetical protein